MTATYKPLIEHSKYPVVDTRPLTSVELDLQGLENIPDLWEMNISDDEDVHAAPAADTSEWAFLRGDWVLESGFR